MINRTRIAWALPLALSIAASAPIHAQTVTPPPSENTTNPSSPVLEGPSRDFVRYPKQAAVTHHTITVNGETVHYRATAGTIGLADHATGDAEARMFYIAYERTNPDGVPMAKTAPAERPITFSFNGGPGSSSVWLHLGVYGPHIVQYADDFGNPGPPPYTTVPNELSLLDKSDFVFIDPISTGLSRPEGDKNAKDYHGLEADAQSVAEFIRMWISRTERWASPKFITGESYGTTRCATLAPILQDDHGITLNGVILVSAVLNFQTIRFGVGNDLPHILTLPTFAATSRFHSRLGMREQNLPLADFIEEVERFTVEEYAPALMWGDALKDTDPQRYASVVKKLALYTGLSEQEIEGFNLRLEVGPYNKALMRTDRRTVGRLDSRYIGIDRMAQGGSYEYDPSYSAILGNYTGAMNTYLRTELKYDSDLPYEILTNVWPWSYEPAGNARYVNVAERLRSAMTTNPHLKVFIASGYYDLATPHFATDYTFNTMQLDEALTTNYETHYYEAGHMMYLHRPSLEKLRQDLAAYYDKVLNEAAK